MPFSHKLRNFAGKFLTFSSQQATQTSSLPFLLFLTGRVTRSGRCPWSATLSPGPSSVPVFGVGPRGSTELGCHDAGQQFSVNAHTRTNTHTRERGLFPGSTTTVPAAITKNPDFTRKSLSSKIFKEFFPNFLLPQNTKYSQIGHTGWIWLANCGGGPRRRTLPGGR